MASAGKKVDVRLHLEQRFQTIDGFGVNLNTKYWTGTGERLKPAIDLLVDDLGARLFRVDIWGKSNWVDPGSTLGLSALEPSCLHAVYSGETFRRGWAEMRDLNERGIEPYLTASGDVPRWMLAEDGRTLKDYEAFTTMLASLVEWAVKHERIRFRLFGPLNETDLGSPEGPLVSPFEYVKVCELLVAKLDRLGLDEIRLVVPETSSFRPDYLSELVKSRALRGKIAAFAMHDYHDIGEDEFSRVTGAVAGSPFAGTPLWFGEFGDLEQSGAKEWYVAWVMYQRLLDHLLHGFSASLAWDAFDNYHDHDEWWTIYGLLRTGLRVFTPKPRYYSLKQVFRFVEPGFVRVGCETGSPDVRAAAFLSPGQDSLVITGANLSSSRLYYLNIDSPAMPPHLRSATARIYRTSEHEHCALAGQSPAKGPNWPFTGIEVSLPPDTIFTVVCRANHAEP